MVWRAIRVGLGLGLVGLCVMVVEVQALACGDTISTDTTLRQHLLNCPDDGLIIDTPGVNLNLNGKRITGQGRGVGVDIDGVANVTVRNGTVRNFGTQVFIRNSPGARVRHMTLRGAENFGIQVEFSDDVVVKYSHIRDIRGLGVFVISSNRFVLRSGY